jgi:hypothetical protein
MLEAFIFIWCICGIAAALISQSKNRNPVSGAFWGLGLGVIGVLIVACRQKLEPGEKEVTTLDRIREFELGGETNRGRKEGR